MNAMIANKTNCTIDRQPRVSSILTKYKDSNSKDIRKWPWSASVTDDRMIIAMIAGLIVESININ